MKIEKANYKESFIVMYILCMLFSDCFCTSKFGIILLKRQKNNLESYFNLIHRTFVQTTLHHLICKFQRQLFHFFVNRSGYQFISFNISFNLLVPKNRSVTSDLLLLFSLKYFLVMLTRCCFDRTGMLSVPFYGNIQFCIFGELLANKSPV